MKKIISIFLFCSSLMFGESCSQFLSFLKNYWVLETGSFVCNGLSRNYVLWGEALSQAQMEVNFRISGVVGAVSLGIYMYFDTVDNDGEPACAFAGDYSDRILVNDAVDYPYTLDYFLVRYASVYNSLPRNRFNSGILFCNLEDKVSFCDEYDGYKICNTYENREWKDRTFYDLTDNSEIYITSEGTGYVRSNMGGSSFISDLVSGEYINPCFELIDGSCVNAYTPPEPDIPAAVFTDRPCSAVCSKHGGVLNDLGNGSCTCNDMSQGLNDDYVDKFCTSHCGCDMAKIIRIYDPEVNFAGFSCGCVPHDSESLGIPSHVYDMCGDNIDCLFKHTRFGDSNLSFEACAASVDWDNLFSVPIDIYLTDDGINAVGGRTGGAGSAGGSGSTGGDGGNTGSGGGNTGGGSTGGGSTGGGGGVGTGGGDVGGDEFANPPVSPPAGGGNPPGGGGTDTGGGNTGGTGTGSGTGSSDGSGDHDYSGQLNTIIGHLKNIDDTLNADITYDSSSVLDGLGNEFSNFASNITAQYNNAKNIITGNFSYGFNPVNGYCSWNFHAFGQDVSMYNSTVKNMFIKMRPYVIIILSLLFWFSMVKLMLFLIKGNI